MGSAVPSVFVAAGSSLVSVGSGLAVGSSVGLGSDPWDPWDPWDLQRGQWGRRWDLR